jgi:CRP/FNR family transcriptional regulator, cyclic AMP receptor protein
MLKNVSLFQNIPDNMLAALSQHTKQCHYPKNTILFMEGDESTRLFVIESGKVNVFVNGDDGKQVILNILGPGEYFGELSLLDGRPRSASVITLTACVFTTICRDRLQAFIQENPDFAMDIITQLVNRIRDLTHNVKDMALLDVYGRVAQLLRRLADESNKIENPKLTHQEIANMVGASREMVSRIMKELLAGEYIERSCNGLVIKKRFPVNW